MIFTKRKIKKCFKIEKNDSDWATFTELFIHFKVRRISPCSPPPSWVWYLLCCYSGGFSTNKSFTHIYIIYIHFLTSSLQITRSKLESQMLREKGQDLVFSVWSFARSLSRGVRTDLSLVSTAVVESASSAQHRMDNTTVTATVAWKCTSAHKYDMTTACDLISTPAAQQPAAFMSAKHHTVACTEVKSCSFHAESAHTVWWAQWRQLRI